jgi:hypothetical protein
MDRPLTGGPFVSKSICRCCCLSLAILIGVSFLPGCGSDTIPLAKPDPKVLAEQVPVTKGAPKGVMKYPGASSKIRKDPSGINRNQ